MIVKKFGFILCAALAVSSLTACGDDDENNSGNNDGGNDTGGEDDGGDDDGGDDNANLIERLFAMGIRLRLPDGTTTATYLKTYESLQGVSSVTVDTTATELEGQRRFTKINGGILVESVDQPSIQRYDFDTSRGLVAGATMSLAGRGFTQAGFTFVVNDTKAYNVSYTDLASAVFNPQTMLLATEQTLDLASVRKTGFVPNAIHMEANGDRLFIAVAFWNPEAFSVAENLTVAVVNTTTNTLETVIEDTRCRHAAGLAKTENGDIYVLGDNGYNILGPDETTCIARIASGTDTFDAEYLFEPNVALGGREASELYALRGNTALTYALYFEALGPDPTSVVLDPVRKPWAIDLAAKTAREFAGIPLTKIEPIFRTSQETFLGTSQTFEATTIFSLDTTNASAVTAFTSEGNLQYLIELP